MNHDLSTLMLAAASGGVVAGFLTVFGGGGSVLAVPLLVYLVGVKPPHVAIGVSAAGVALNALTALIAQARAGRVQWRSALIFALFGTVGAWLGSSVAKRIDGNQLLLFFALAMAAVALSMLRPTRTGTSPQADAPPWVTARLAGFGTTVGTAAGFFGIGGGFLIVPGLMAATGMSLSAAQASSLVSVTAFGASTAANYSLSGLIDWTLVAAMVVGGVIGTELGLPLSRHLGEHAQLGRRLFAGLILTVAIYVAVRAIWVP